MPDLLPPWPLFSAFLVASLVLAVTPGPGVLYIVARSLAQGQRAGLASVAGVALGNLGNALLAAWGLATLFAFSHATFITVKFAGALYLVYMGVRILLAPRGRGLRATSPGDGHALRDGVVVALLNPKTLVFFAAFLPQFMTAAAPAVWQALALGALFVAIAFVTDTIYALTAASVPTLFNRAGGIGRKLSGCLLIGLGLMAALTDNQVKLK